MRLVLSVLVLLILLPGCGSKPPPGTGAEKTVEKYIAAAGDLNWREAVSCLTGEALAAANQNTKHFQGKPAVPVSRNLEVITRADGFALVHADVTQGHDRWNYKFYLTKKAGRWLIYEQELSDPLLPALLEEREIPKELSAAIKTYVTAAVKGDWAEAGKHLTGQAKIQAQRHDIKKVNLQGSVSDFRLTPVGEGNGYFLVHGSYTVKYPGREPIKMDVMFTAADCAGTWKITRIDRL